VKEAEFRRLVSGERRGWPAALVRGSLRSAEALYHSAVRLRNWRYDSGRAPVIRAPVPVVSVGNLSLGGTGKTPMVAYLARWFRQQQIRVAIVSRGYRSTPTGRNDEALELELQLPDVPHLQNPDRPLAVQTAVEELDMQLIILDDGFQHRRLARDLDLVLLDALEPFGYGHVFPRGFLREAPGSLRRADVVALSRADLVDAACREEIRQETSKWTDALWIEVAHRPLNWRSSSGRRLALEELQGVPLVGFCGIGNPEGFRRTLSGVGSQLAQFILFPDHHPFDRDDLDRLAQSARDSGAAALVCTSKDLVKVNADQWQGVPVWALEIELAVTNGQEELHLRLQQVIDPIEPCRP
jgi:tetraacyldisaccharide 4'-kinase